jgi:hypothetical protein
MISAKDPFLGGLVETGLSLIGGGVGCPFLKDVGDETDAFGSIFILAMVDVTIGCLVEISDGRFVPNRCVSVVRCDFSAGLSRSFVALRFGTKVALGGKVGLGSPEMEASKSPICFKSSVLTLEIF